MNFVSWKSLISNMATAVAMAMLGGFSAHAAGACRETICAEQGWTRATPGDAQTAAIYFSIINQGDAADILVKASTPVAASAMFHRTTLTKNIARMDMVANIPVPAHGRVTFGPLGYHAMLTGLKAPLAEGARFPLTLDLASGRHLSFDIHVVGATANGPLHPGND